MPPTTRHAVRLAIAFAALAGISVAACGNLVIPPDTGDDDDGGASADADPGPPDCDAGVPVALECTGLYSDWPSRTVSPDAQPYAPGVTMWADGATSQRWIYLPAGSKIDTTDPNDWSFPVGTKLWQQYSLLGSPIETRFLWKESAGQWFRATYAWSDDLSSAPEVTAGVPNARGLPYEIPPVAECEQCHDGEADFVLGFEEVGLAMPGASGLDLAALEQQQFLTQPPAAPPRVPGDAANAFALAYLHVNCGTSCHNRDPDARAGQTGLYMKLVVDATGALPATEPQTDTWLTSYLVPSHFTPSGFDAGGFYRILPGNAAASMVTWRMSRRDGVTQMPPIATHLVDTADVQLLDAWVNAM